MGGLKNIVYNPETGLFEDSTNPTAHLTNGEARKRRPCQTDPMSAQMKPVINSLYLTGGEHPLEGTNIEMSWYAEKTRRVVVTFPSGRKVEFPAAGSCRFVVPGSRCQVRIVAHNGKYTTQCTLQITPTKKTLITRFLEWLNNI